METILELNKFKHIKYHDEPHLYYVGDDKLTSATTFIGKFKPKFDTENISKKYAYKHGMNVEDVIAEWDYKRDFSTIKGSAVHDMAENWWNDKYFPYPAHKSIERFGEDVTKEAYYKCEDIFKKFYEDAKENLVPIKMEMVVGDLDYGLAGMIDCLFYNKKFDEIQIWDYKTNKKIAKKDNFGNKFKTPISHLDVCEWNTYSLQLSLYKHILEKNTNLKVGSSYLIWINEVNDNYKIIKTKDLNEEIVEMLKYDNRL